VILLGNRHMCAHSRYVTAQWRKSTRFLLTTSKTPQSIHHHAAPKPYKSLKSCLCGAFAHKLHPRHHCRQFPVFSFGFCLFTPLIRGVMGLLGRIGRSVEAKDWDLLKRDILQARFHSCRRTSSFRVAYTEGTCSSQLTKRNSQR